MRCRSGLEPLALALMLACVGCSPAMTERGLLPSSISKGAATTPEEIIDNSSDAHDCGTIISNGSSLEHSFRLKNETDRSIHVLEASAFRSCCSSIGPVPKVIPPGGVVVVPVRVNTKGLFGPLRADYSVTTDHPTHPYSQWTLSAHLILNFEITEDGAPPSAPIYVGRLGSKTVRLTCRRDGGLAGWPTLGRHHAFKAAWRGEWTESTGPGGTIQAIREVVIGLPAFDRSGIRTEDLQIVWPDGRVSTSPISWEVVPILRAHPRIVLLEKPVKTTVTLESSDGPFRIRSLSGPFLTGHRILDGEGTVRQLVELSLDPTHSPDSGKSAIEIVTDHPDQNKVTVGVIIPR